MKINEFADYIETDTGVPFDMVAIKGGTLKIGSRDGAIVEIPPKYDINISDFYMGKTEVTNVAFAEFLTAKGNTKDQAETEWLKLTGSYGNEKCRIQKSGYEFVVERGYERHPVIYVSWYGAKAFAEWLCKETGKKYRLPSEAEWEYAARGGQNYKYAGSNNIDEVAWFASPTDSNGAKEVARKKENGYGLYDMCGNVYEWCEDDWHETYLRGIPKDGSAWTKKTRDPYRVQRGGSWASSRSRCRVAYRRSADPNFHGINNGFRLVCSL